MEFITLDRIVRLVWVGTPFNGLKSFSLSVPVKIFNNHGGSPVQKTVTRNINKNTLSDVHYDFGSISIQENSSCELWAGAGPIIVEGQDNNEYEVWFASYDEIMFAEDEEVVLEATWHVTANV